jgi:hypothetical protein
VQVIEPVLVGDQGPLFVRLEEEKEEKGPGSIKSQLNLLDAEEFNLAEFN